VKTARRPGALAFHLVGVWLMLCTALVVSAVGFLVQGFYNQAGPYGRGLVTGAGAGALVAWLLGRLWRLIP
jgi:hypothetical protein